MKASEEGEGRKEVEEGNDMKNIRKQWTVSILPSSFHSGPLFSFLPPSSSIELLPQFFASFFVSSQAISSYSLSLSFSFSFFLSYSLFLYRIHNRLRQRKCNGGERKDAREDLFAFLEADIYFGKKEAMKPTATKISRKKDVRKGEKDRIERDRKG